MLLIVGGSVIVRGCALARSARGTRVQLLGPDCANGIFSRLRSTHQGATAHSHLLNLGSLVDGSVQGWLQQSEYFVLSRCVATTGSVVIGTTRSLPATLYTFQSFNSLSGAGAAIGGFCGMFLTSVRFGLADASRCTSGVHVMKYFTPSICMCFTQRSKSFSGVP